MGTKPDTKPRDPATAHWFAMPAPPTIRDPADDLWSVFPHPVVILRTLGAITRGGTLPRKGQTLKREYWVFHVLAQDHVFATGRRSLSR